MIALVCSSAAGLAWADGAVYTMTNALGNNQILVYHRYANGILSATPVQTISTGGGGSGLQLVSIDSLGSAGSIQLDAAHRLLFAVNTESAAANNGGGAYNSDCQQGTITSFVVAADGTLTFADRVFSRGLFPNSLTVSGGGNGGGNNRRGRSGQGNNQGNTELLYVLNAGGSEAPLACNNLEPSVAGGPNITGFSVASNGIMEPIGSTQPVDPGAASGTGENCSGAAGFAGLTGAPAADFACGLNPPSFPRVPSKISFTPDGSQLVVTVRGTNSIDVFPVNGSGSAGTPVITQASLPAIPTYAGFAFDSNEHLLVAEIFGSATSIPALSAGGVSSFDITRSGDLNAISSHVGNNGTASCWLAVEPIYGVYAYVTNNLSNNVSSYSVTSSGQVTLVSAAAATPAGPNDVTAAAENGSSFVYVVAGGSGTVAAYQVNLTNGALTTISGSASISGNGTTAFPQGIAAF